MYSKEKRKKAINLYLQYDKCAADVIHELGYPDQKTLKSWYREYVRTGTYWEGYPCPRRLKYTLGQKETAVEYYFKYGLNISRTVRALGYPSRETFTVWCDELTPGKRKIRTGVAQLTLEEKQKAVFVLCTKKPAMQKKSQKSIALPAKRYIIGRANCFKGRELA